MTSFQFFIYLSEVELQCDFSLAAAAAVDGHFSDSNRVPSTESEGSRQPDPQLDHAQLFRSIHSFLTHTAIVSRLLWPGSPMKRNKEDRGSYDQRREQAENRGRR